jgi:microcystin-dependent protein
MDEFIGIVKIFAGNFAPRGWALCQGQILSIAQNTALFSILGTTYGGNGQTTFALPDLRGRMPIGQGQGPGLPSYSLGQVAGAPSVQLSIANMPAHNHGLFGFNADAESTKVQGNLCGTTPGNAYAPSGQAVQMNGQGTTTLGNGLPYNNMNPYLAINYIICMEGLFPSRN